LFIDAVLSMGAISSTN